ncbi:MAG: xanthine dehydrogenase family protein molybdopterin-binding subunit [Haloarculaceae archaeon]
MGTARGRREDPALVTGSATYTDDVQPAGVVHAAVRRSPYGHARVERVDVDPATEREGVVAAFGAADLADAGGPTGIPTTNRFHGSGEVERPLLVGVGERARFSGDPVAVVFAEDRYLAHDALDAITVEYERLPAVSDPREAPTPEGPSISDVGADTAEWSVGDESAVDRAVEAAAQVVSLDLEMPRLVSAPMETRAVLAEYGADPPTAARTVADDGTEAPGSSAGDPAEGLTVTTSTQTPHQDRDRLAGTLGLSPDRVRVIAPDVGGGFGPKGARPYPEEPLVAWAAMHLDRPVKWVATRTENNRTEHQGRGVYATARLAVDEDGTVRGLGIRGRVGVGGYPFRSPAFGIRANLLTGAYDVPAVHCRLTGVLTNTPPLGPYRGAGRPEAIYVIERLMDRAAAELGIDPAEMRRRNFVPPDAFPYETALGYTYDSGEYEPALDLALERLDYEAFRERQAAARAQGRYLGVGIGSFVENTGTTQIESGRVEIDPDGTVRVYCGTADQGQGHATTYARLLADEFGVDETDVEVHEGDTDDLPTGTGTYASRSIAVGGGVLLECAREVLEEATRVAADDLEVAPEDVAFEDGTFAVRGAPGRAVSLTTVARHAHGGSEGGSALSSERVEQPAGLTYAFGTHVAVVEADPESGEIAVERYVAVDDCGTQIDPTLVEGQVHGAVAQGLGQALREEAVHDGNGTMLTASFQDYAMPRAHRMPDLETDSTVTPSPVTPHGAKGAGEAGTIAAPPAVVNAVVDALRPFDVEHVDTPVTPETVWRAVRSTD